MVIETPKREFVIPKTPTQVGEAILNIQKCYPGEYQIDKADDLLNQYRLVRPGPMLDLGHYIDFTITKVNDQESKVVVELNKRGSVLYTPLDMGRSAEILKEVVDRFGLSLKGDIHKQAEEEINKRESADKALSRVLWVVIILTIAFVGFWIYQNRR